MVDFARAVDAEIVTSFATSAGTRDASGRWTPTEAERFLAYNKSIGGRLVAAESMNEPTAAKMGGAPKGYDAAAYGRDIAVFRPFIRKHAPGVIFLGPWSVGEGGPAPLNFGSSAVITTADLLKATGPVFDAFSYHRYAAVSKRCASMGSAMQVSPGQALSRDWLSRADGITSFYAGLRDRYLPGKPLCLTETADAACGGNPWASTFLDTFRYLDQHGGLAKKRVQMIAHNTLASSDYGLLDENTFSPRPNYWASLLWRRLMGSTVLEAGRPPSPNSYIYAHCLRGQPSGVALLVINADTAAPAHIEVPVDSERYLLTANRLEDARVQLNGTTLELTRDGSLPEIRAARASAGTLTMPPASIAFVAVPTAGNPSCR